VRQAGVRVVRVAFVVVCAATLAGVLAVVASASPTNSSPPTISGTFVDGGSLSASAGTWSSGVTAYQYQWRDCTSYSATILADHPTGYWRLDETANPDGAPTAVADDSGNGNGGSYYASPTFGATGVLAGDPDTAVALNGSSQYATLGGSYPTGRSAVTLEAWFKPAALTTSRQFVLGYGTTSSSYFYVGVAASPHLYLSPLSTSSASQAVTPKLACCRARISR